MPFFSPWGGVLYVGSLFIFRVLFALVRAVKIRAKQLRDKPKEELLEQLEEMRSELASLRVLQVTGGAPNKLAQIKVVRKNIARVLTVFNQQEKAAVRPVICLLAAHVSKEALLCDRSTIYFFLVHSGVICCDSRRCGNL